MLANLPKNELENVHFCRSLLGQKYLIRILGELKKPKSPFEINWPLAWPRAIRCYDIVIWTSDKTIRVYEFLILEEKNVLIRFYGHEHFYLSWEKKQENIYNITALHCSDFWGRLHSRKSYKNDISLCSVLKAFYYYFWKSSFKNVFNKNKQKSDFMGMNIFYLSWQEKTGYIIS